MVHKCNLEIKSIIIITFRLMIVELCFLFERLISWALYPKFILEHGLRIDGKTHSKDAKNMRLYLPTSTNDCCWIPVWYIKNHVNTHVCFLLYVFLDYIFNLKNTDSDNTTDKPRVLVDRTLPPFSWTSIFFSCMQHFAALYVSLDDIYTINASKQ
jgi:hypothetical protein